MIWRWPVFLVATIVCTGLIGLCRVRTNRSYIEDFGPDADYRATIKARPSTFLLGTFVAGAIYATVITTIAGLY